MINLVKKFLSVRGVVIVLFLIAAVLFFLSNRVSDEVHVIDQKKLSKIKEEVLPTSNQKSAGIVPEPLNQVGKVVIKKKLGDYQGSYFLNTVYQNEVKIAEFKEAEGKIYEVKGKIPDGETVFENTAFASYGTEYYKNGKREGVSLEYFQGNKRLRQRSEYYRGELLSRKEYNYDGSIRFEKDFRKFNKR